MWAFSSLVAPQTTRDEAGSTIEFQEPPTMDLRSSHSPGWIHPCPLSVLAFGGTTWESQAVRYEPTENGSVPSAITYSCLSLVEG